MIGNFRKRNKLAKSNLFWKKIKGSILDNSIKVRFLKYGCKYNFSGITLTQKDKKVIYLNPYKNPLISLIVKILSLHFPEKKEKFLERIAIYILKNLEEKELRLLFNKLGAKPLK